MYTLRPLAHLRGLPNTPADTAVDMVVPPKTTTGAATPVCKVPPAKSAGGKAISLPFASKRRASGNIILELEYIFRTGDQ